MGWDPGSAPNYKIEDKQEVDSHLRISSPGLLVETEDSTLAETPRAEARCWPGGRLPAGHSTSVDGAPGLAPVSYTHLRAHET